MEPKTN
jgi:hypothetical protein